MDVPVQRGSMLRVGSWVCFWLSNHTGSEILWMCTGNTELTYKVNVYLVPQDASPMH